MKLSLFGTAGIMVRGLMTYNTMPNLFCSHPPFQIDGNLGLTGAVSEMLLQSHTGEIELLPAIPEAWARKGSYRGLCARGGYVINCEWIEGKVVNFEAWSAKPGKVNLKVNGITEVVEVKPLKRKNFKF